MEFPQPPAREPNSQLRETAPNRKQRRAQTRELEDRLEEAATEIASLRRELAELREDKRIVDELLDAAITDYNEARQEALEEAAQAASPNSGNGIFSSYEHGRRDAAAAIRNLAGEKADGPR
jgi:uncharacterized protein (DUF3084 family)